MLALVLGCIAATARAAPSWPGFQIIEWQPRTPAQLATLRRLGVTAGMVLAQRQGDPTMLLARGAQLRAAGLGCYVENIATDFYAAYHRWVPNQPVNWRFIEAQRAYRASPFDTAPFIRDPSLSDPVWMARVANRLEAHVRTMGPLHPLFYDLGDETGIADLSAFWDFDFSPVSLQGFRDWLQGEYGSLAALNREWDSHFAAWSAVMPRTTREAIAAPATNLAPWADFKTWMDVAFARAIRAGTAAVHRADPAARAGLEGAQIPGWGGYDYTRLARAVDVMELYDSGENLAILRSQNPAVIPLATTGRGDRAGLHAIWRAWLRGARGLIMWDDSEAVVRPDGTPGPRGQAYAPVFATLRGTVGMRMARAHLTYDPVAILYSPASFRIQWMTENRSKGAAWAEGSAETDAQGNATRTALSAYARSLAHQGIRPRYVSDEQIAAGTLTGIRVLILPDVVALSDAAVHAIRAFARAGGHIIADGEPGQYDAHGRQRSDPLPLAGFAARVPAADGVALSVALVRAGMRPTIQVDATDIEAHVFREGSGSIVALQRDLSDADDTETVTLTLPRRMRAIDLRSHQPLGVGRILRLDLRSDHPRIDRIVQSDVAFSSPSVPGVSGCFASQD